MCWELNEMEELTAHYNGIDVLKDRTDLPVCLTCGTFIDKWSIALDCPRKPGVAFSLSRDGYWMVHPRFKAVCESSGIFGGRYLPLASGYFILIPTRVIRIEQWLERRKLCPECGTYEAVMINGPPKLAEGETPPAALEMTRSDTEVGSRSGRTFGIWVGNEAADILRSARLKGLDFTEHSYPGMTPTTRL